MSDSNSRKNDFLNQITDLIEENISNDQFGVSELAGELGMSRSNLLRKIKNLTNISVSKFIRQVRLKNAMEELREASLTVSEVSYKVGFSSTSYFIKCFHDYYGYPPGEVGKRDLTSSASLEFDDSSKKQIAEQNNFIRFWRELKRRKVVKVIIVYSSISFILLELVSILIEPLYLPQWVMTLIILLLGIGFLIAIVFSWIYEITPTGIEVTKSGIENRIQNQGRSTQKKSVLSSILIGVLLVVVLILAFQNKFIGVNQINLNPALEKSIAVLPFKNDSNDSTNVYIINGLMESVLTNLQKIKGLRVISRTSVEKYRNNTKTIPELSKELNVNYFVDGSGQKIGDKILLNIQLIEASTDNHLWAEQYNREAKDIFKLQREIAKNIVDKIEVIITPEEKERINKLPTDNLVAYDFFLKGLDLFNKGSRKSFEEAIPYFKRAIEHDNKFAQAYANVAITYYFLDVFLSEKKYSALINYYADKALLLDSKLPESLVANAVFYMNTKEYELAVPYLEKALQYNPNSALAINFLSEFYTTYIPNTEKYLEYALKGIQLDITAQDSITASFIYLHVSNAFIQSGFINEAEKYINKSLDYNPENIYSAYVKPYILYAKNEDLLQIKESLIEVFKKDSTRFDVIQEIGKICYYMRDYETSYEYYKRFIAIKDAQNLNVYRGENLKIGLVLSKMGETAKSEEYFNDYLEFAENNKSIYKHLSLAMYYSYMGDTKKSIEQMKLFSQQDNYEYWIIVFLKIDPLIDTIKDIPEFKKILNDIEIKFWNNHKQLKASFE